MDSQVSRGASNEVGDRAAVDYPGIIAHRVPGASDKTNIPETKIWDAIKNGELAAKKCGRTTLIEDQELRRWIRSLPDRVVNRYAANRAA